MWLTVYIPDYSRKTNVESNSDDGDIIGDALETKAITFADY
jgi:hypothetical protein